MTTASALEYLAGKRRFTENVEDLPGSNHSTGSCNRVRQNQPERELNSLRPKLSQNQGNRRLLSMAPNEIPTLVNRQQSKSKMEQAVKKAGCVGATAIRNLIQRPSTTVQLGAIIVITESNESFTEVSGEPGNKSLP